jgi:two-component system osmolarity sensor histidine kinase EnvZ
MNTGMQGWLVALERMLPRSLLGRSILIIVTPIVLLQVISAWVFYDSHWNTVTKRLAQSVAGEIGAVTRLMPRIGTAPSDSEVAINTLFETARDDLELELDFKLGEILPNDPTIMRQNLVDRQLAKALEDRVERPFIIDSRSLEKYIEIHVQLADGVLHVVVLRRRLFSSTTYVFLLWMVGTSLALLAVATLFMRNQVKPIKRLAQAADDFGKGREVEDFRAEGATEVALAGQAFNQMRNRIRRQIGQRTEMLAGVSHDLRTPLTRMKLQLAMMGDGGDIGDLKKDVADMERMIGAYLAFARGEGMEQPAPTDLAEVVADVAGDARRQGAKIDLTLPERSVVVPLRRDAFRRALDNVIGNAHRYAGTIAVTMALRPRHVEVMVDDDGPGIPAEAREDVFKPFFRLEQSRNQATGGTGLGLTIARDIIRGHGGDLVLSDAPGGGLRAVLRLPL